MILISIKYSFVAVFLHQSLVAVLGRMGRRISMRTHPINSACYILVKRPMS